MENEQTETATGEPDLQQTVDTSQQSDERRVDEAADGPTEGEGGVRDESEDNETVSKVESAGPADACRDDEGTPETAHPLSLSWSFGFNPSLPVHNISEGNRKMIFYSCGHTAVLYDCVRSKQCQLQGHGNLITCTAVSGDRRWLVTADTGRDCMLTVWDSFSAIPVRTIFEGLGGGCVAVAMSRNAQYVATLSTGTPQVVCVWDWTSESDAPLCSTALSSDYEQQTQLTFNPEDSSQLVSSGEDQVVFYSWKGSVLKAHSTPVSDKDFSRAVGTLSQSVFIPGSSRALSGTSEGCGVVWEDTRPATEGAPRSDPHSKKPLKLMKMQEFPLTVVTSFKNFIVTGDIAGQVRFFDTELKLVNWYDSLRLGPLVSISFAHLPNLDAKRRAVAREEGHFYPSESAMREIPFVIPDFTVSTTTATIAHVTTNGSTVDVVFREHDAAVHAVAAHPSEPRLLVGSYSCRLKLWDYEKKEVLAVQSFEEPNYLQCLAFDPKGEYIGVGFTHGVVGVLDALTLEEVCPPFRYSRDCITHISFSHDSQYMATADLDMCVTVFVAQAGNEQQPWQFLGKHRAHYKPIVGLMFGVVLDSDAPTLLSIARDRTLVEYDLRGSGVDDLQLMSVDRIEQSAVPLAMAWYPPLTKESFILLSSDQYKLKLYNSTTKMCRKTLLGPTYGSPLRKLVVLPAPIIRSEGGEERRRYLAYITSDKVGLLLLPHDGNPHNSTCLVAHPGRVADLVCSHDGRYVFTAGGEDCVVSMWTVSTDALEAASLLGGEGLVPFYAMLEGGREGDFFSELEEHFYYAQIRSQGPDAMSTREVSTAVPLQQIPYIMRAIGFYPSEQEIEDMLNEVKFSKYVETGACVTEIDLGDFIKLYVNHRPAFGLSPAQLARAFRVLGGREGGSQQWAVDTGRLLTLLQEKGEHITEGELVECLMTLLGHSEDPEGEGAFSTSSETALQELPDKITAANFAEELLGLSTQ